MTTHLWLVPVQAAPVQLKSTLGVLDQLTISYVLEEPERARERLDHAAPFVALVHGGPVSPLMIDVQRWFADFAVPTMLLVEKLTDHYEAVLLHRGAEDVISLPASARRIASRLDAMTRRVHARTVHDDPPQPAGPVGRFDVDPIQRTVAAHGQLIHFTTSEFDLFVALIQSPGGVSRKELADALAPQQVSQRALESHVSRMRAKLNRAGAGQVESVRGYGYRLVGA